MTTFNDFLHTVLAGPAIKKIFGNIAGDLMHSIREEHPDITNQTDLVELFYKAVKEKVIEAEGSWINSPWIEAAIKYLGFNTLAAQHSVERYHSPYWKGQRERAWASADFDAEEKINKLKTIFIGDVVCPNGKTVKQNTGTYLRPFSGAIGRIAEAAGDNVVQDVLSDTEISKLSKATSSSSRRPRSKNTEKHI